MDKSDGIEDRITSSSLNGIYPSVIPSVNVIDVVGQVGKVVVVVKIQESIEAPHAVDNSTRVYIRTGSQNNPCDLAEIDRIEYFFKRRKDIVDKRNDFFKKSENRCNINIKSDRNVPNIEIIVSPLYPYQPIITPENLMTYSKRYGLIGDKIFKQIPNGIVSFGYSAGKGKYDYFEINCYGFLYYNSSISKTQTNPSFLKFPDIYKKIYNAIENALQIYKKSNYSGNIFIKTKISHASNESIIFSEDDDTDIANTKCFDNEIDISNISSTEELEKVKDNFVDKITEEIVWAFNRG